MNDFTVLTNQEEKQLIQRFRKEKQHEEYKYLHLMQNILDNGNEKSDRTGTGTKSIFGTKLEFNLRDSFPILTTKKVFWKGVVEELLWFIRGETDSNKLADKGVKIWVGNTTREFLDKKGLDYPEGFIGPGYGFQWRYWGGEYNIRAVMDENYKLAGYVQQIGQVTPSSGNYGVDQLKNAVETIKNNPNDRRIIVSAWNPAQLEKMALPPCHLLFQFFVENGELSCQWYQRSVDVFLGLPFNISSYALLTCLIAKITGLKPGKLIFSGGDTHLYMNHLEQTKEQISRVPYQFPKLNIKKDIKTLEDIEKLEFADLELEGYQSHATIKAAMAV
jgi:thymidylate synthase